MQDFNSTMVRLKALTGYEGSLYYIYFNSTMVRLKALYFPYRLLHIGISIPLWYD